MIGEEANGVRTAGRVLAALAVVAIGVLGLGARASAQEDDDAPQRIQGRVFNEFEDEGERVREPVPDVRIVVETEAGEEVGEGLTDAEGAYVVGLAEPGTYVVRIDAESLPEGVAVEEGEESFTKTVGANGSQTQVFFLGEDLRSVGSKWDLLPQTLANGLKLAMIIAMTSVGLSLIYGTTGLSNFAHGEMVTFGALMAYLFNREIGWHLIPSAVIAVALTGMIGMLQELGVWRPLRRRKISLTSMMIVSIGLALAVRYVFLFFYGGGSEAYRQYTLQPDPVSIGPVDLAPRSLWVIGVSAVVIVAVALFLLKARFGKAIRAVSDNPDLASSSGIDADRVILVVWLLGGALAGLGGIFYGLEFGVKWDMGFTLLLLMFAAITLGGLGNPFGALVGSLVIGIFVELWTWIVPNANDLKTVGALAVLIAVLLVRPQGLLGSRERVG